MAFDIKNLKPRKNGHYKQGYFDVSKSTKYMETDRPVIYRSGLEYKVFNMLEKARTVKRWCSEPSFVVIKYEYGGKIREYFMDVYVEYENGNKQLIEIKPFQQTQLPKLTARTNEARYHKEVETYKRNIAKWEQAHKWCNENNMTFKIMTEKTINKYL